MYSPPLLRSVGIQMRDFLISYAGSLAGVATVFGLYLLSAYSASKGKAYAEIWWLPGWNCFRFVIRNMHGDHPLTDIAYRAWLREVRPSGPGSSVSTFVDAELATGHRILLPTGNDYPVLCFRFETKGEKLYFVHTDKMGAPIYSYEVSEEFEKVVIEYSVKVQTWKLLKHEIRRILVIPRLSEGELDVLQYLSSIQDRKETLVPLMFGEAEEIKVSI